MRSASFSVEARVTPSWSVPSPVGFLTVLEGPAGLVDVTFAGSSRPRQAGTPTPSIARAISRYFEGDFDAIDELPVDLHSLPPFQRAVLTALRKVPAGEVTSYGELAAIAGRPGAARAVGQAVRANPVAVVVPCHRVVAADGTLGGFASGLDRKRWLLAHEGHPAFDGGWEPGLSRGSGRRGPALRRGS